MLTAKVLRPANFVNTVNVRPSNVLTAAHFTTLAACGGGSTDTDDTSSQPAIQAAIPAAPETTQTSATTLDDLQGNWESDCELLNSDLSNKNQIVFDGLAATRTGQFFVGSDDCSSDLVFSIESSITHTLGTATSETPLGIAQHVEIVYNNTVASSSELLDAQLALENSSFDTLMQENFGVTDTSSISPESLGIVSPAFSIIMVDEDKLYFGANDSNQGVDEETRLTELDTDTGQVFSR